MTMFISSSSSSLFGSANSERRTSHSFTGPNMDGIVNLKWNLVMMLLPPKKSRKFECQQVDFFGSVPMVDNVFNEVTRHVVFYPSKVSQQFIIKEDFPSKINADK